MSAERRRRTSAMRPQVSQARRMAREGGACSSRLRMPTTSLHVAGVARLGSVSCCFWAAAFEACAHTTLEAMWIEARSRAYSGSRRRAPAREARRVCSVEYCQPLNFISRHCHSTSALSSEVSRRSCGRRESVRRSWRWLLAVAGARARSAREGTLASSASMMMRLVTSRPLRVLGHCCGKWLAASNTAGGSNVRDSS